jgi:hypothetical protein
MRLPSAPAFAGATIGARVRLGYSDRSAELAVDAAVRTGRVEVPAERVEHRLGRFRVILECFRPGVKARGPGRRRRNRTAFFQRLDFRFRGIIATGTACPR